MLTLVPLRLPHARPHTKCRMGVMLDDGRLLMSSDLKKAGPVDLTAVALESIAENGGSDEPTANGGKRCAVSAG